MGKNEDVKNIKVMKSTETIGNIGTMENIETTAGL